MTNHESFESMWSRANEVANSALSPNGKRIRSEINRLIALLHERNDVSRLEDYARRPRIARTPDTPADRDSENARRSKIARYHCMREGRCVRDVLKGKHWWAFDGETMR